MKMLLVCIPLILSCCVRYDTTALDSFPTDLEMTEGVAIVSRAFTKNECREYLDRDVIAKGYQPIQIYIRNTSDNSYLFLKDNVTLPIASAEEVSKKVHTSTVGRIAGYGAAALLASPLFAVPAVVDGFKSTEANISLDRDFLAKAARDCVISPQSHINMVLFVPRECYEETFTVTLIDESTNRSLNLTTSAR